MLSDLVDNDRTDINTTHSYLELYQTLLEGKKDTATHVLDINISQGGNIKLWSDFFTNATVYGVDTMPYEDVWSEIKDKPNIVLYTSSYAYNYDFIQTTFVDTGIQFDFILVDGQRSYESMIRAIQLHIPLLKPDGILIQADIQELQWTEMLKEYVPDEMKHCISVYDRRNIKDRYDDIVFVVDKRVAAPVV